MSTQSICFLAVQPHSLLVGKPGGFANEDDFWKFAAGECGFEGTALHMGVDTKQVVESSAYRDDVQARFRGYGLKEGVIRFEMHGAGQNICLDPSRGLKMGHFVAAENFRNHNHRELESLAAGQLRHLIDVTAAMGFRHLPGFCGGRGYAIGQSKWSAWPKHFTLWVLALLAAKWEPILEYAADRNVVVTFEIGHPENDILTGENFVTFYRMLSDKAQRAVGVNADASHFVNVGTNPMPHFRKAVSETGCEITNHYKWGAVRDLFDGSASPYGGWRPWSTASTSFYTIGTVGPESLVREYHAFIAERDTLQSAGVPIVWEGECVGITNPKQAMKVGAHNCRALRDGGKLIRLEEFLPHEQPIQLAPFSVGQPYLQGPEGRIALEEWGGGPFDVFADCPAKPYELLSMHGREADACRMVLERAGYKEAAQA